MKHGFNMLVLVCASLLMALPARAWIVSEVQVSGSGQASDPMNASQLGYKFTTTVTNDSGSSEASAASTVGTENASGSYTFSRSYEKESGDVTQVNVTIDGSTDAVVYAEGEGTVSKARTTLNRTAPTSGTQIVSEQEKTSVGPGISGDDPKSPQFSHTLSLNYQLIYVTMAATSSAEVKVPACVLGYGDAHAHSVAPFSTP